MPKKRSVFQAKAELFAVRAIFWFVGAFSLKKSMSLGKAIGKFLGTKFSRLQKTARRNLEIAYPNISEDEKERIVRGTFESLGRHLGFVSHFHKFKHEDIRNLVELVGREHFDEAHASGRGILFFTGHFGSWEVFNLLPPAFGYRMNILVRRIDNVLVENFVDKMRTRFGSVTLDKMKSVRQLYRLLEKGELVGILADLNVQEGGRAFVNFFDVPASTTTIIAKLALTTKAIIMPAFAVWDEEKQKYIVYIEPPVECETTGNTEEDLKNLTQKITGIVEKYVRKYPEQWLWIHKRWNTRPKGDPPIY